MNTQVQSVLARILITLREVKRGYTLAELSQKIGVNIEQHKSLQAAIANHPNIKHNPANDKYQFVYDHNIVDKDDLYDKIQESDSGILTVTEDMEKSIESLKEWVTELQQEGKIFCVAEMGRDGGRGKATKRKGKDVLFFIKNPVPEEVPLSIRADIKDLWHKTLKAEDFTTMRKILIDRGIGDSQLDCNWTAKDIPQKKPGRRAPRKGRASKKKPAKSMSRELERLIEDMAVKIGDTCGEVEASKGLEEEEEEDDENSPEEIERRAQERLRHKVSANPAEFALVCEIVNIVGRWFYDDIHCVLLGALLEKRGYKENELAAMLKLTQKQVGTALVQLMKHQLVLKSVSIAKPSEEGGRTFGNARKTMNCWAMNLDCFINATQYRLMMITKDLEENIEKITSVVFSCPNCEARYCQREIPALYNMHLDQYFCRWPECKAKLNEVASEEKVDEMRETLRVLSTDLKDLLVRLKELPSKRSGKREAPAKMENRSGGNFQHLGRRTTTNRQNSRKTALNRNQDASSSTQRKLEIVTIEETGVFDCHPLIFGIDNRTVFLPIVKDLKIHRSDVASLLAKEVLDEVAEFKNIISSAIYVYEIHERSLYLGYSRGFSGREIVRLLCMLGRNAMPMDLQDFIVRNTNGNYYKATITVREGKKAVRSNEKEVLSKMLNNQGVRSMAVNANAIEEVTSPIGNYYAFAVQDQKNEEIKKESRSLLNIPLIDEMDYINSTTVARIDIKLKDTTFLRPYQRFAASRVFWNKSQCHSGVLVLPCGAGKTLIGIDILACVKRATIIFCFSNLALNQWKEQIEKWTNVPKDEICRFSSAHEKEWRPRANIVITTYTMFSTGDANANKRKEEAMTMIRACNDKEWGLMILDEVHLAPAKIFRAVANKMKCHIKVGLTATMVREDNMIEDVPHLVGPKLFDLDIFVPLMYKHIAPVKCMELQVPLTPVFASGYASSTDAKVRKLIWTCNPNKIRVVHTLIKSHLAQEHKIMLFCDTLFALHFYETWLKKPKIEGNTLPADRQVILNNFRKKKGGDCCLFSTVGDQSIDLPEADVVIQLALTDGSRMQEGQRIGRVQRPEEGKITAYFYSLISEHTREAEFAHRRRNFLEDNGYSVDLVTDQWERYVDKGVSIEDSTQIALMSEIHKEVHQKARAKELKQQGIVEERVRQPKRQRTSTKEQLNQISKKMRK